MNMRPFGASELAAMQALATSSFPDTAQVQRNTPDSSTGAAAPDSFADVGNPIACNVAPAGNSRTDAAITARLVNPGAIWVLSLPAGTDAEPGDRITVYPGGSGTLALADQASPRVFELLASLAPRSYELSRRLLATETTTP